MIPPLVFTIRRIELFSSSFKAPKFNVFMIIHSQAFILVPISFLVVGLGFGEKISQTPFGRTDGVCISCVFLEGTKGKDLGLGALSKPFIFLFGLTTPCWEWNVGIVTGNE